MLEEPAHIPKTCPQDVVLLGGGRRLSVDHPLAGRARAPASFLVTSTLGSLPQPALASSPKNVSGTLAIPGRRGHAALTEPVLLDLPVRGERQPIEEIDVSRDRE